MMTARNARRSAEPAQVFVLEDDPLNAMLIEETLHFAGHAVVGPAKTIPRALDLLGTRRIDVGLLDLQIEDALSIDVAEQLDLLGVPWAITSAYAPSLSAFHFPHVPFLVKPFTVVELLDLIDRLLDREPCPGRPAHENGCALVRR
jgi:CheY-like chemotaxis protein